jgi:hypothetical protein
MYNFTVIPTSLLEYVWFEVSQRLLPVVEVSSNELSIDSIKASILNGKSTLIIVTNGARLFGVATLEIQTFDTGLKTLYIPIIGGSLIDEWGEQFFCMCKDIAKQFGCTELRGMAARTGWVRKLKQHDLKWKSCYEVIKYDLTGE